MCLVLLKKFLETNIPLLAKKKGVMVWVYLKTDANFHYDHV